jgi:hypothetical protein
MDDETATALAFVALKLGVSKNTYVIAVLRRAMGLDQLPDPDTPQEAKGPEVPPPAEVGKDVAAPVAAQIARQIPAVAAPVQEASLLPATPQEPESSPSVRARQLPRDFSLTPDCLDYAVKLGVFDPAAEFEQFCDHHTARGTVFKDWNAAWRTWARNAVKYQQRSAPNATSIHSEKMRLAAQVFGSKPVIDLFGAVIEGQSKRLPG